MKFLFIIALPVVGFVISNLFGFSIFSLEGLKISFEKEDVDVEMVLSWLDSLDEKSIESLGKFSCEDKLFPEDIQAMLCVIEPRSILIEMSSEGCLYLEANFDNPIIDIGVVIGINPEMYSRINEIKLIEIDNRAFIWMENRD